MRGNLQNLWLKLSSDQKVQAALSLELSIPVCYELEADECVLWPYAMWNLKLLHLLRQAMLEAAKKIVPSVERCRKSAPALPADVLGALQQKTVVTSLQLIVCLGICPNLLPGIGIPLELRSGFAALLTKPAPLCYKEKRLRLSMCCRVLLECVQQPNLGSLVLSRCLGDLLAALMQLRYGPVPKINKASASQATLAAAELEKKQIRGK